jgi:hypothetical protein
LFTKNILEISPLLVVKFLLPSLKSDKKIISVLSPEMASTFKRWFCADECVILSELQFRLAKVRLEIMAILRIGSGVTIEKYNKFKKISVLKMIDPGMGEHINWDGDLHL